MTKDLSNIFYKMRFIAIIATVLMHTPFRSVDNAIAFNLLNNYAAAGATVFLFLNGYFFKKSDSFLMFWKKKFFGVLLPWFIAASLNCYKQIYFGNVTSFSGYLLYCVGYKNIYYYLTMMCACLLIFWIVDNNFNIKKIFVLITLVSLALNDVGVYDSIASALGVSYYQYFNVLNYIGVFSLGNIFREKELFQKYLSSRSIQLSSLLISLFVIATECLIGMKMNPFIFDITNKVSWFIATLFVSTNCIKNSNILIDIGKNTLFIYLYQLFLTSNILVEDEMLSNAYIAMLRPLIIVVLLYCASKIGYLICDKVSKKLAHLYTTCTGVK